MRYAPKGLRDRGVEVKRKTHNRNVRSYDTPLRGPVYRLINHIDRALERGAGDYGDNFLRGVRRYLAENQSLPTAAQLKGVNDVFERRGLERLSAPCRERGEHEHVNQKLMREAQKDDAVASVDAMLARPMPKPPGRD